MAWGMWAFTRTCLWMLFCTGVQVCRHAFPHSHALMFPPGSLALGPAAAAGTLLSAAPVLSTSLPRCHACPVSPQAAAPRGCTVPVTRCSCAWRASPSSRRNWLTTRRTASGKVSLARTHTHTHTTLWMVRAVVPGGAAVTLGFCRQ